MGCGFLRIVAASCLIKGMWIERFHAGAKVRVVEDMLKDRGLCNSGLRRLAEPWQAQPSQAKRAGSAAKAVQ